MSDTGTTTDNAVNRALFAQISQYLSGAELAGLFTVDAAGNPGGWLWEQITTGIDNEAALQIALEATEQFQARYGIIQEMRQQAASGAAVHVPNVAQVREYEQRVTAMMRQAGLPEHMWDNWRDTHEYMRNGLSAVEIEQRLGQSWERVQSTPPEVRAAFDEFYGTLQGDAALAALYLDPTKTLSSLERQSRVAYTAGMGRRLGLGIDQEIAEGIAALPRTEAGIYEGLTQLNELDESGIFTEGIAETDNLTTEGTGVDAVFGGSSRAIERRTRERQANNAAVPGGAIRTQGGATGLGST